MTELELLEKIIIENGGEWWLLEEENDTKLFKVVTKFQDGKYYHTTVKYFTLKTLPPQVDMLRLK